MKTAVSVAICCAVLVQLAVAGAAKDTVGATLKEGGAQAFAYNPTLTSNGTLKSGGGSRSQRMVAQWPALAGQKISQTVFTLEPCAMRPAHVHPRATGLLYVVSGANLTVGFVTEDGNPVVNSLSTGASAVFPIGLVHYQQNLDCYDSTYIISYNSEDPGTQMTYPSLLSLPDAAVAATLGLNTTNFATLRAATPNGAFIPLSNSECLSRCHLVNTAQPPQPTVSSNSIVSG